jgi:hypothetical protein
LPEIKDINLFLGYSPGIIVRNQRQQADYSSMRKALDAAAFQFARAIP